MLAVDCHMDKVGSKAHDPFVKASFKLAVTLRVAVENNKAFLVASEPRVKDFILSEHPQFPIINQMLARLYFYSILDEAFDNTRVFGSGIPTLERKTTKVEWIDGNLVIYEPTI
jgi:hypothetical protein